MAEFEMTTQQNLRQRNRLQAQRSLPLRGSWVAGAASTRYVRGRADQKQRVRAVDWLEVLHALQIGQRVIRRRDVVGCRRNGRRIDDRVVLDVIGLEFHDATRGVGDQDEL